MSNLTPKQEAFVRAYLSNGGNASAAYREAYDCAGSADSTVARNAHGVLRSTKVAARIEGARQAVQAETAVTVALLTAKALEIANGWQEGRHPGAAVSALKLVAEMHGLRIEKREDTTRGGTLTIIRSGEGGGAN